MPRRISDKKDPAQKGKTLFDQTKIHGENATVLSWEDELETHVLHPHVKLDEQAS